ncbi:glycosyltransferase [Rhodohalobacter sulfatireducens]|uniref:Glycosyltransferase n=1 Tax=Rhodohalobacter sulfatireducens TaxID=2911366 RepID=A0ABS9KBC0_9BACT|nr:glycosyltransferase family 2 protein [Rhodohalobacter sulfatireducens]MCG2588136.1 glycosyltransferase [Rhodohalobacter sulfatireducens]
MSEIGDSTEKKPLLSVIIPVYNVEDYVRDTLDSVRNQSYKNVEFIVINDGSTDSSGDIIEEYRAKDDRFRIYHQENVGLSTTRNRGLRKAQGDIIYFFDSDDVLIEGAFEKVIDRMQDTDSQIVFFGLMLINKDGKKARGYTVKKRSDVEKPIKGKVFLQQMITSKTYGAVVQKYFIRKSFLEKTNLTFEDNQIHEDESFTLETLCLADRITSFSETMIKKRLREHSIMSTSKGIKNVEGWARAIERVLNFINKNDIDERTREAVLTRLRTIAHTAIRTLRNLDHPKKPVEHYLPNETQNNLGFLVKAHAKSTFLYRVFKFINRKIG